MPTQRPAVLQAARDKKPVYGIEIGASGVGLRGLAPISHQGQHLGAVEFGLSLDQALLAGLKEKFGVDFAVLIPAGDKWQTLAATQTDLFTLHPALLNKIISTGQTEMDQDTTGGRDYLTNLQPLKDFSGKDIGVVAVKADISTDLAAMRQELYVYTGAGTCGSAGHAGPAVFPDGQTGDPRLQEVYQTFRQMVKEGNLNLRVPMRQVSVATVSPIYRD